jgi:O-methyltransferase
MSPPIPEPAARYLDLLARCLTRDLFLDEEVRNVDLSESPFGEAEAVRSQLKEQGWRLVRPGADRATRAVGNDWPPHAETMVGLARLENVLACASTVLAEGVPGDFVETGVWRGGTSIYLRAILAALGDPDDAARKVWACDSFEGLPEATLEIDEPMQFHTYPQLAVGIDQVKANFDRYGLLDERVELVQGWFSDTLPTLPVEQIALLRLDGDMYESTMDALVALEAKVAPGGFVLVDDYAGIEACAQAVTDYRAEHGITAEIHPVDWTAVWWRKPDLGTDVRG